MKKIDMDTMVRFTFKGAEKITTLKDMYDEDEYGTEEEFFDWIQAWVQTGRAHIVKNQNKEADMADKITEELMHVKKAKAIEEDRIDRQHYNDGNLGYYKKVAFPAKTLLDAQELMQMFMKNFNLKEDQLGVEMKGRDVIVTIEKCPIKTYAKIERALGYKRATEVISDTVDKTAKSIVDVTDMTANNIVVPVAKTAISTTAKVGKGLFGLVAKLGGITVSEVTKATKQCVTEIKNDGYILEARGEVIDGVHAVRRSMDNSSFGGRGMIIE
jgi:hypothetical protein